MQELVERGSFLTTRAGHVPIVVVRDRDGVLRGFVNVCRHRGHEVTTGCGRRQTLQCPYHAWTYGLDGKLLDLGKQKEVSVRELIHELIDWFLRDVIDELGTRKEIEYAYKILESGSSADRQLKTFAATGSTRAVVDQLVAETQEGVG